MRYAPEESVGRANKNSNPPELRETSASFVYGSELTGKTKNILWPEIDAGIRGTVSSFPLAAGVGGWLGTVIPLAGLGAVSGVLVLRKRFLR